MKICKRLSLTALSLILVVSSAAAQVSITTLGPGGAYQQNFTALGIGDFALTDNTSIPGVYAFRTIGNTVPNFFFADDGTGTAGAFRNYGIIADPERAMGSLADGSTGALFYGIRFQNDTASTITSVEVRYFGEQWRDASGTPESLDFSYRVDAGDITDLTSGTYVNVASLAFTTPSTSGVGAINGNLPGNRTEVISSFNVNIPPGGEVMIRWTDLLNAGANHGLAIDDVQVTFRAGSTAADATIAGRVVTANGRGISGARVFVTGGDLAEPRIAITNAFGYYQFTGLESGSIYAVSVNSKRYNFQTPTRTVDLSDSAFGVDFVAQQ